MVFERLLADQLNARLGRVLEGVDRDDVRVGVHERRRADTAGAGAGRRR